MEKIILTPTLVCLLICVLSGCGGGSGAPYVSDPGVTGRWLEVSPSGDDDLHGFRPTRLLTLASDGAFTLEEAAPENRASGAYRIEEHRLTFTRTSAQGAIGDALTGTDTAFTVMGNQLIISEETAAGSRSYQFTRLSDAVTSVLVGEWVIARRLSDTGAEVARPCSTRLVIGADGAVQTVECTDGATNVMQQGEMLCGVAGYAGMRLPAAGGNAGRLLLLGAWSVDASALTLHLPGGGRTICAYRTAPDPRLVGEWALQGSATSAQLRLNSDGTYTRSTPDGVITGVWRTYYGKYLCLITPDRQCVYAWNLWGAAPGHTLTLGTWSAGDESTFAESRWARVTPYDSP